MKDINFPENNTVKKCVLTSDRYKVLSDSDHSKQTETDSESRDNQSNVDTTNPQHKHKQRNKTRINHEQRPFSKGENVNVIIGDLVIKDLKGCEMSNNGCNLCKTSSYEILHPTDIKRIQ